MPERPKPWFKSFVERVTGLQFATGDEPRLMECDTLLVTREDEIIYCDKAIIEFVPNWGGVGALRVIQPVGIFPDISVETYSTAYTADRARTAIGMTFGGADPEGTRYEWRINGAAVRYMKRKVQQQWTPGDDEEEEPAAPIEIPERSDSI